MGITAPWWFSIKDKSGGKFLPQLGLFAAAISEEIQPGPSGKSTALHGYFLNNGGSGEESSFHTDTIAGNSPDSKTFAVSAAVGPDYNTFKLLDPFIVAFFNPNKHGHCIPGADLRNIGVFWCFQHLNQVIHLKYPSQ